MKNGLKCLKYNIMRDKTKILRLIVGIGAICYIVYMWVKKDIFSLYQGMDTAPLLFTNIFVSLFKVMLLAGVILIVKKICTKQK